MLHDFVTRNRHAIVSRVATARTGPVLPAGLVDEPLGGLSLLLTQISDALRSGRAATFDGSGVASATRCGGELRARGFTAAQVVHYYGSICDAITDIANEQQAPITAAEFNILNHCLDVAMAEAISEHERRTSEEMSKQEVYRLGVTAHELRDIVNTALLALHAITEQSDAADERIVAILGRSLSGLQHIVDSMVSGVRLAGTEVSRQRIAVAEFMDQVTPLGQLHAEYRELEFKVEPVDPSLTFDVDAPLLTSAVMNLLHNAFKNTRRHGHVVLRSRREGERVLIEIEDECGGIPHTANDLFQAFSERRGRDRKGLGLGLSIARDAARANDGDIRMRNMPGKGCVFIVEVPLASQSVADV